MKTRFNNDIRKYFSRLNKMLFCLPAVYNLLGFFFFCLFLSLGFSPPFSQISIDADHLAFFFFPFQKSCINKVNCIYVCKQILSFHYKILLIPVIIFFQFFLCVSKNIFLCLLNTVDKKKCFFLYFRLKNELLFIHFCKELIAWFQFFLRISFSVMGK